MRVAHDDSDRVREYQGVIPRDVRVSLGIEPGQKIEVIVHAGRAEFIPVRDPKAMRGFLRGIDTRVTRDKIACR